MDPPIVYIETLPFEDMILSAVESFRRECLGLLRGSLPSRRRNYFVITDVVAIQLAKKRKNKEVDQSQGGKKRMNKIFNRYPKLYGVIGDFHSHPEWGQYRRETAPSDDDIAEMIREKIPLGVIINISILNKERILWHTCSDGGVKGSLGDYKLHIRVFRILPNGKEQSLQIEAAPALKALNRALGYE